jgi:hypothetical protein
MIQKTIIDGISIIYNVLSSELEENITHTLESQCHWDTFTINGKTLCRTGSFEGDQLKHDSTPWLRCPSIEYQTIYPWSPITKHIRDYIACHTGYTTNIAKIQKYPTGDSIINVHSDKIIDLDQETPIFILRFGVGRTCILQDKITKECIHILMPHNSCLILDYKANLRWLHGIKSESHIKTPSYSIVFRKSVTFKTIINGDDYVYGPHTPCKTYTDLLEYVSGSGSSITLMSHDDYKEKIIECYKKEKRNISTLDIYREIINSSLHPF